MRHTYPGDGVTLSKGNLAFLSGDPIVSHLRQKSTSPVRRYNFSICPTRPEDFYLLSKSSCVRGCSLQVAREKERKTRQGNGSEKRESDVGRARRGGEMWAGRRVVSSSVRDLSHEGTGVPRWRASERASERHLSQPRSRHNFPCTNPYWFPQMPTES